MINYTRGVALGYVLMCLLTLDGCQQRRRPERYLIPAGYVGWVEVEYSVPNAPPLPIEDNSFLIRVPQSGRVRTSTPIEYGWAKNEYYYDVNGQRQRLPLTGWGGGGLIWAGYTGERQGRSIFKEFIGTEAQWRRSKDEEPGDLNRRGR